MGPESRDRAGASARRERKARRASTTCHCSLTLNVIFSKAFPLLSMSFQSLLSLSSRVLIPLACVLSFYLYLYPIFHGCAFPSRNRSVASSFTDTLAQHGLLGNQETDRFSPSLAPFRLLVLADPQLEGDSSLPKPHDALIPRARRRWTTVVNADSPSPIRVGVKQLQGLIAEDVWDALRGLRKRLDLIGNDYYLAHIFRALNWWSKPTHVTVLGDLIGSQWVKDDEFEWRGWRYWNRVFPGRQMVEDEITNAAKVGSTTIFSLGDISWKNRIINIAGNHDIGYAGDISSNRMERFERVFGKANWDVRFQYPTEKLRNSTSATPSIHLIVLNSLLLDTPAMSDELQAETIQYLNSVITTGVKPVEDRSSFTLLLTHLPLFKKEGVCIDPPYFDFWGSDDGGGVYKPHGLKEQNHLSQAASEPGMLESIFGMKGDTNVAGQGKGRSGVILTGHDHEGCDTWHYIPVNSTYDSPKIEDREKQTQWEAVRWQHADKTSSHTGVREVTLRSMMGDFGGNAGLLSAWFDFDAGEWQYEIQMCKFGVQHIWWAVHITDMVAIVLLLVNILLRLLQPTETVTVTSKSKRHRSTTSKNEQSKS